MSTAALHFVSIQLIGIQRDPVYEYWKKATMSAIQDIDFNIHLEEVNETNNILSFQINSIPALSLNQSVFMVQEARLPDEQEIKSKLEIMLKKKQIP